MLMQPLCICIVLVYGPLSMQSHAHAPCEGCGELAAPNCGSELGNAKGTEAKAVP
jgi:hypothetical protein